MIEKRYLARTEFRKLKEIKAIIVHWPGGDVCSMNGLWEWMNINSANSYHYFVSREKIIQVRREELRAVHCGHRTYTNKAREFFGERACSKLDSPNNYTLAVCLLHDKPDGSYFSDTMETAIELLSSLCEKYGLDPRTQILRHSDLTDEKRTKCPHGFFEAGDDPDDLWNEFREWIAESMENDKGML